MPQPEAYRCARSQSQAFAVNRAEIDDLLARAKAQTARKAAALTGLAKWCPQVPTPAQQVFLALTCSEGLFGGAAGPGKSSGLLMDGLQHADEPRFAALALRRTYADLSLPGALMDRAADWLRPTGAHWNDTRKTWTFPSSATLTFGYLETERDKYRYAGAEFQRIYFDELTQFEESQYRFLQSRLRRTVGIRIAPASRSGSNPGGVGHDWVLKRFVDPKTRAPDVEFIPAKLSDNPHVDADEYRRALSKLDETTRQQLEEGIWVRDSGGQLHKFDRARNVIKELPALPYGVEWSYGLCVDLGSSETVPTTAFGVTCWHPHSPIVYVAMSFKRANMGPSDIAEQIRGTDEIEGLAQTFDFEHVIIDQGGLGSQYINEFVTRWAIPAEGVQKANKLGYRKLLNGALERAHVLVVEGTNEDLISELQSLQWNAAGTDAQPGQPDHLSDALLYSFRAAYAWSPTDAPPSPARDQSEALEREARELRRKAETRDTKRGGRWWT